MPPNPPSNSRPPRLAVWSGYDTDVGKASLPHNKRNCYPPYPDHYLNPFTYVGYRNNYLFSHTNPYILNITQQCWWSYFELGLPVLKREPMRFKINITFFRFYFFCLGGVQICRHFDTFVFFFSPIGRIYSINRPGRLLNFWTLRVGAYSGLGAY